MIKLTKAQKIIRKSIIRWTSIGLKPSILSDETGYAFSTCRAEIKKVKSEGKCERNWDGDLVLTIEGQKELEYQLEMNR